MKLKPNYDPKKVIAERTQGIIDLTRYIEKIKKNILVFKEAIQKEKNEMKKTEGMIKVLKKDIKEAKKFL
jgi:peptidoglycan hydrolase CwlO-like protein